MQLVHKISVEARQLTEGEIVKINSVDTKAHEGQWIIDYPDGTRKILNDDVVKAEFDGLSEEDNLSDDADINIE